MQKLCSFLRDNMIVDFQGEVTPDKLKEYIEEDGSPEARALLQKCLLDNENKATDELMLVLADCLQEVCRAVASDNVIREQLRMYSES